MATEYLNIIVQEKGSRVVKRNLEELAGAGEVANKTLLPFKTALLSFGATAFAQELARMVDSVTSFKNRLRLVTNTTQEFVAAQKEIFDISSRTRTDFEGTAAVFTRTALAVRGLGFSLKETLGFTETLNQAIILSGANAREAEAALIQLSQGLASGALRGDELRSVLEQLPYVADIIGKEAVRQGLIPEAEINASGDAVDKLTGALYNARGQLRALGTEGALNTKLIFDAIRNTADETSAKFSLTVPTIGQAFSVLRTEALRTINTMDTFTNASGFVAEGIISLANSLDIFVFGIGTAAVAFTAFKLSSFIGGLVRSHMELTAAISSGNAVLLTSVEIERAKAASSLQEAVASQAQTAAKVRQTQAEVAYLQAQRAVLAQQQASLAVTVALARTDTALAAARAQLTRATAAQAASEAALTAAQSRSAAANVAANTMTARLANAFPLLASVIGRASAALSGLWSIMLANPVAAIIAAVAALVTGLVLFSDKIGIIGEDFVTLRDVGIATFQLIAEALAPVIDFISSGFSVALEAAASLWDKFANFVKKTLTGLLSGVKSYVNFVIGYWTGLVSSLIKIWRIFPDAVIDVWRIAINKVIDLTKEWVVEFIKLLTDVEKVLESIGLSSPFSKMLDDFSNGLDNLRPKISGSASQVGRIFSDEFKKSLNVDYIGGGWEAILVRSRKLAQERMALAGLENKKGGAAGSGASPLGKGEKNFQKTIQELTLQNELLRVGRSEREILQGVLKIEEDLKRKLTASERGLVEELIREKEVLERSAQIYEETQKAASQYNLTVNALNRLLKEGRINQEEFSNSILRARLTFLDTQRDMASGVERGFLRILETTGDYARQMEGIITSAFDGMSRSIADLVVDGKADFRSLIKSIDKQIVQLVISQGFQQLFGGYAGRQGGQLQGGRQMAPTGGGLFGGLLEGVRGLFGFQDGGSFQVGAQTGIAPLPGTDNRLIAFRAQDGERVTITPRGESAGGGGKNVVVTFNITTPDVNSFRQSQGQLAAKAARMIGQGQRNM